MQRIGTEKNGKFLINTRMEYIILFCLDLSVKCYPRASASIYIIDAAERIYQQMPNFIAFS